MLASHDREHPEDHHFEPVNYRRDIILTKRATRKNRRKRRTQLQTLMRGVSSNSIDGSRADRHENFSALDETDDVPDIPIPLAEYPEAEDELMINNKNVVIPMVELVGEPGPSSTGREGSREEEETAQDSTPQSPNIVILSHSTSRNTAV